VIFHFGRDATGFSGVLIAGPQMVTFFLVLSGFVMTLSYLNKKDFKG
jgi:peptidoglycan/LPS O-acetylase OafA/YrhL